MGQSNMAAGATIGSNHNSRGADGELVAGRGFWPGLCVSLKHNSKFASFTLIAKGDFPAELNIRIPFSLVSNDVSRDRLVVMPGYWFMYNMYALTRNAGKYGSRDNRTEKIQELEYDFLAPDSVNELFDGLHLLQEAVATAWYTKNKKKFTAKDLTKTGTTLLEKKTGVDQLEILAEGFENSVRKVELVKVAEAAGLFRELIIYYGVTQLVNFIEENKIGSWQKLKQSLPTKASRQAWTNVGGQLIPSAALNTLVRNIHSGKVTNWDEVHAFYAKQSQSYSREKTGHAFASLMEILKLSPAKFSKSNFRSLLQQAVETRNWIGKNIYESRAKDYQSQFRKMVYDTEKEMEKVIGKLKDNGFIKQYEEETVLFRKQVDKIINQFQLSK
jgi:hypothetical protein